MFDFLFGESVIGLGLYNSACNGKIEWVKYDLDINKLSVNTIVYSTTALGGALWYNKPKMALFLLDRGAKCYLDPGILHDAIRLLRSDKIRLLVWHDPEYKNVTSCGITAKKKLEQSKFNEITRQSIGTTQKRARQRIRLEQAIKAVNSEDDTNQLVLGEYYQEIAKLCHEQACLEIEYLHKLGFQNRFSVMSTALYAYAEYYLELARTAAEKSQHYYTHVGSYEEIDREKLENMEASLKILTIKIMENLADLHRFMGERDKAISYSSASAQLLIREQSMFNQKQSKDTASSPPEKPPFTDITDNNSSHCNSSNGSYEEEPLLSTYNRPGLRYRGSSN